MTIFINDSNQKTTTFSSQTTIDITNVLFLPGANRVGFVLVSADGALASNLVPTSVQIDPGGSNQANFVLAHSHSVSGTSQNAASVWYLKEADIPQSSKTVRVTFAQSTSVGRILTGVTLTGVDQSNTVDATAQAGITTAGTAMSANITISQDSSVINVYSGAGANLPVADGSQIELDTGTNASPNIAWGHAYEIFGSAGQKTQGWTFPSEGRAAMVLAAFKEAPGTSHQQQIRRGKADSVAAFTGAPGELVWNIDDKRIHGQDGFTQGGVPVPNFMDVHNNQYSFAAVSGTADAIALTLTPASASLKTGMQVWWIQDGTNTGAVTINLDGHAAISLRKTAAAALLAAGDLLDGQAYTAIYDGTFWQLPPGSSGSASVSLTKIVEFTSSGTYNVPAGVTKARVTVVGGGGNGAGVGGGQPDGMSGGGGGAGGVAIEIVDLSGVSSVSVTVGTSGGTTSFGSFLSATGGAAGTSTNGPGGVGGAGSGGDINITGNTGGGGGQAQAPGGSGWFGLPGAGGRGSPFTSGGGIVNGGSGQTGIVIIEEFS